MVAGWQLENCPDEMIERYRKLNLYFMELTMGIAYKELFREKDRVYGFGPAGYFIRRFKKSGCSEAELLDLVSGMNFSLGEAGEDISLEKKCEIIERAVTETHYTSWALNLIGMIISLVVGAYLSTLPVGVAVAFLVPFLVILGIYAWFRFCFERNRTVLLCAIDHIRMASECVKSI